MPDTLSLHRRVFQEGGWVLLLGVLILAVCYGLYVGNATIWRDETGAMVVATLAGALTTLGGLGYWAITTEPAVYRSVVNR